MAQRKKKKKKKKEKRRSVNEGTELAGAGALENP